MATDDFLNDIPSNQAGFNVINVGSITLDELAGKVKQAALARREEELDAISELPAGDIIGRLYTVLDHLEATAEGLAMASARTEVGALFLVAVDKSREALESAIAWIEFNSPDDCNCEFCTGEREDRSDEPATPAPPDEEAEL